MEYSFTTDLVIENLNQSTILKSLYGFLKLNKVRLQRFTSLYLAVDKRGLSRGKAFLEVPCSVEKTVLACNGKELDGRKLKIKSIPRGSMYKLTTWVIDYDSPGVVKAIKISKAAAGACNSGVADKKAVDSGPELTDMGADLTHRKFRQDLDVVFTKAEEEGISTILIPGKSLDQVHAARDLCNIYPDDLVFTAGVSPACAGQWKTDTLDHLKTLASNEHCIGIGLTGIDVWHSDEDKAQQIKVFEAQVKLACDLKKPLFLVMKVSFDILWSTVLSAYEKRLPYCVLYCFDRPIADAKQCREKGFFFSITGHVTNSEYSLSKNVIAALQERVISPNRLLLASNSPHQQAHHRQSVRLSVSDRASNRAPGDAKRATPSCLFTVLEMAASILEMKEEELAKEIVKNTNTILYNKKKHYFKRTKTTEEIVTQRTLFLYFVLVVAGCSLFTYIVRVMGY